MKRQRKSLRPNAGTEAQLSYLFIAVAGGFAMTLVRNETQRHSAALNSAGQSPIGLLPLHNETRFGNARPAILGGVSAVSLGFGRGARAGRVAQRLPARGCQESGIETGGNALVSIGV